MERVGLERETACVGKGRTPYCGCSNEWIRGFVWYTQMNSLLKWKCRVPGNTPVCSGTDVHKNLQVSRTDAQRIICVREAALVWGPFTCAQVQNNRSQKGWSQLQIFCGSRQHTSHKYTVGFNGEIKLKRSFPFSLVVRMCFWKTQCCSWIQQSQESTLEIHIHLE